MPRSGSVDFRIRFGELSSARSDDCRWRLFEGPSGLRPFQPETSHDIVNWQRTSNTNCLHSINSINGTPTLGPYSMVKPVFQDSITGCPGCMVIPASWELHVVPDDSPKNPASLPAIFDVQMAKFVTVICRQYTGQGFTCAPMQGVQPKSSTGLIPPDMATRLAIYWLLDIRANNLEQTSVQDNASIFKDDWLEIFSITYVGSICAYIGAEEWPVPPMRESAVISILPKRFDGFWPYPASHGETRHLCGLEGNE
ncbi:hypothetical protein PCH_Pc18g05480 [Penicillium rubens Wisconsin 54-1255]|uniref:Uncharacterized protein n=1 Tax=Penicillium rubens (strain ATCC 28089 / DSM 1075 / NRRL 1951 / Wisconsin 54-1255) TaxID=500485 RepID=B6HC68_PENRW|nr:hypothetical protein PCH_Pc18g05480 [Penicillium rubens Wisconsin 54-1255]